MNVRFLNDHIANRNMDRAHNKIKSLREKLRDYGYELPDNMVINRLIVEWMRKNFMV